MSLTTSAHWGYNPGGDFYGYTIDQSVRYNGNYDTAPRFTRSHSQNRKTWTCSFWIKRTIHDQSTRIFESLDNNSASGNYHGFTFNGDATFHMFDYSSGYRIRLTTAALFRDLGAWYHIVVRFDSTQATASDRVRLYVNGEQVSWVTHTTYPSQNLDGQIGNGTTHYIGRYPYNSNSAMDGYLAEFIMVEGSSLDASNFGETKSGVWIPKEYTGSYGTNGFKLNFSNASALGTDSSGNGNNWTSNDFSTWDQVPDSPTNNFNNGMKIDTSGPGRLGEAGLRSYVTSQGNYYAVGTSMAVKGGKWYYESRRIRGGNNSSGLPEDKLLPDGRYCNSDSNPTGSISINVGTQDGSDGVYMTALDLDNGYVYRGRNGSWSNGASAAGISSGSGTGAVKTLTSTEIDQYLRLCVVHRHDTGTSNCLWNFGQDSTLENYTTAGGNSDENGYGDFKYAPPTNFLAMCSQNVPDPAIDPAAGKAPDDYFNSVTYTGVGGQSITGVGFQPDWVWIKSRNVARDHKITDAVRGVNKELGSHTAAAEVTRTTGLTSFDSDGFTVGSESGYDNSGDTFVAWNWLAGNSTSSNTDGTITSTVSVNQEAGFSIVTYTGTGTVGATVGHGLGATPNVIIIKSRSGSGQQWATFHSEASSTAGAYFLLNKTDAVATDSSMFNNTNPTSSVFTVTGASGDTGRSGSTYVAYCFAEKEGYSKFGSYVGGSGTFVHTGFRPAFIMIKRRDASGVWLIVDSVRDPYNTKANGGMPRVLLPNLNNAEDAGADVCDGVSNGFRFYQNATAFNASGGNYIYMAFAEQPFKYANAR